MKAFKIRRVVKTRGHFLNNDADMKLLYLVFNHICDIWKMPPLEWFEARVQFAVIFADMTQTQNETGPVH